MFIQAIEVIGTPAQMAELSFGLERQCVQTVKTELVYVPDPEVAKRFVALRVTPMSGGSLLKELVELLV